MKARLSAVAASLIAGGVSLAIAAAPGALAQPQEDNHNNPLLPQCEVTGGSSVTGGQTTECATEGNVQIDSTPPVYGMFPWDDEFWTL